MQLEKEFIFLESGVAWKPPLQLVDTTFSILKNCPINYDKIRNPFAKNKINKFSRQLETRLWQSMGVVLDNIRDAKLTCEKYDHPINAKTVPPLMSMRAEKRNRREMRKKSLAKWYDLPKTELTKDDKEDLEFIKLRRVLTNVSEGGSHVKRSDSRCTHFQRGVVVDDPGDFHHRLPKKLRGQTLVDEICRNAEIMREQRLRYRKVKASQNIKKAAIRRRNAQIHRKLAKKGDRGRKMQLIPMK